MTASRAHPWTTNEDTIRRCDRLDRIHKTTTTFRTTPTPAVAYRKRASLKLSDMTTDESGDGEEYDGADGS